MVFQQAMLVKNLETVINVVTNITVANKEVWPSFLK